MGREAPEREDPGDAPEGRSGAAQDPGMAEEARMVREALTEGPEYPSIDRLAEALPGVPRRRLAAITRQMRDSNKIIIDEDGAIIWVAVDTPKRQAMADEFNANVL